jgi:hypothetical protein
MSGTLRWLAAALLALAAGCYRGSPPPENPEPARPIAREPEAPPRSRPIRPPEPERGPMAEALAKLTELTDEMCACTDQTCANGVMQELNRWSSSNARELQEQKPTDEETKEATAVAERLTKCMMSTMNGPAPSPASPPSP